MADSTSSALTAPSATPPLSLQVSSVDDLARLARVFAASGLFGRNGNQETQIAECAIRLMAGMEAGFSPFASATGVHIINGRPAFSSNLLAQAVRRHPVYDYRVMEKSAKVCRIRFLANGEEMGVETFTIEMAERAGLLRNPTWKAYPEAMLFSRALTAGMRTHCPDALGGHTPYTPDEIGGEVVPVTVAEDVSDPAAALPHAQQVCDAAGLTSDGVMAFCLMVSSGKIAALADLPAEVLDRIIQQGISAETVAKCNGAPAVADPAPVNGGDIDPEPFPASSSEGDPNDLPAAWNI
jgi:hypothetical protein